MSILDKLNLPANVTRALGDASLTARRVSPQVLLGLGIAGIVGTVVVACRATLKLEEVLDESETTLELIRNSDEEDEEVRQRAEIMVYGRTAANLARLYAPAAGLGIVSVGCLLGSNQILNTRVAGLSAAYSAVDRSFRKYQERVAAELGPEKARLFRTDNVTVTYKDEKGKKQSITLPDPDVSPLSEYARCFDEFNTNWQRNGLHNVTFLTCQQTYANQLLKARGHLFLNEVYDMLGFERTEAGQIVGWSLASEKDGFVDFGFMGTDERQQAFLKGAERSVYLDFNVDGDILKLL